MSIRKSELISVVVPIFNRFQIVDQAIDSIMMQSYRPIEIILVDDHSDVPYRRGQEITDGINVITIRHEKNLGPGASRETGRSVFTGNFLAYMDSDDYWHPSFLEKEISALKNNPDAGMCYCMSCEFSKLPITGDEPRRKRSDERFTTFLPTILTGRPWGTSACVWTRHAIDEIGPWLDAWNWEDYEYDSRAGCHDIRIVYVNKILCYYRKNNEIDQLSRQDKAELIRRKTRSLTQISHNLIAYKKIQEDEIHSSLGRLLYFQIMDLFYIGEKEQATNLLRIATEFLKGRQKLICQIIIVLIPIFRPADMGLLTYKIRKIFATNK